MKLIDILKGFVSKDNTDFAILINGSWGSGKTYFLKKIVAEEVSKINCHVSEKKTEPYELVYVSLYGLTSAEELQKRLFLEVNPLLKSKAFKIAGGAVSKIADFFNVSINSKDEGTVLNIFGGIPKNKILVFDDLERLETSTINEVLGFINTYTEHQNLKVIIVADEEKIKEKIQDYDSVKEKLIRFTYLFNPELIEIFPSFVARYSSQPYQQFLAANMMLICSLFEKGEHKNLRSLRFVLDLFESVFTSVNSIAELNADNKTLVLKRFLFFITTYSIEYKINAKDENLNALKSIGNPLGSSAFDFQLFRHMRSDMIEKGELKEEELSETDRFTGDFEKKYLTDDSTEFEYYDFLATYIHSGDLDADALKDICLKAQKIFEEKKQKAEQIALAKLKNCLTLNDEEFLPLVDEIYGYVDNGVYKLEEYPIIFQNLLNCSLNGIANLQVDAATVNRFKEGMKKSLPHSQFRNGFRNYISMWHQTDAILQEVRDFATNLNDTLQTDGDKALAEKVIATMITGKLDEFATSMMSPEAQSTPIYQTAYIAPASFMEKYNALTNQERLTVCEVFSHFSSRFVHYRHVFSSEITFYQGVHQLLTQQIEAAEGNKQLSTNIHLRFKHWLEETIDRIQAIIENRF